jgi:hypothetical protein
LAYKELYDRITKNGGRVVDQHECFTYQIKPDVIKTGFGDFYLGKIFSARWLSECLSKGRVVPCDQYFLVTNTNEDLARKLNIAKKKKYTIMEGIKLYELVTNQSNSQVGQASFWNKIAQNGFLPERSAD